MTIALAVVAVVFMVLAGAAGGLLLKAVGEVMDLRKEKESLQDEVVTLRRRLDDGEAARSAFRKNLDALQQRAKSLDGRIEELMAANERLGEICEANQKEWNEGRDRCAVLEKELEEKSAVVAMLHRQMAERNQKLQAAEDSFARQEAVMREALKKERAESDRRENAAIKARDEFHLDAIEARKLVASLNADIKDREDALATAKRLVASLQEAIKERNQVVDRKIGENETLRRLLTQQLDAVRKASHALSPSDEWLAMLSKIEDEDEDGDAA